MLETESINRDKRCAVCIEPLEGRVLLTVIPATQHIDDTTAETVARVTAYDATLVVGETAVTGADYTVDRIFNNPRDGFQAVGLISPTHAPVLALRGSNDAKDARADANPVGVGFNQFTDNWLGKKGIQSWLKSVSTSTSTGSGGPVDIVGHSLGGALAQWIAAADTHAKQSIGRVVTFNAPGISATYATRFVASRSLGVTDYIASGDIVSMAGQAFISGEYHLVHFSDESLLSTSITDIVSWEEAKHSTAMLSSAAGTIPSDETIDAAVSTASLNSRSFVYSDPEYTHMLQDLTTAVSGLPSPYRQTYGKLPGALKSRAKTEASRPKIFGVLKGTVV